jgi:hypothetical protein
MGECQSGNAVIGENMSCELKHIKDPQEGKEWGCPKCGKSGFYIYESCNNECEALHPDDLLFCDHCHHSELAKTFIRKLTKKLNLVTCQCCKGTGFVNK